MQVAFSGKSRYGSVYRKAVKGHRITDKRAEVSEMRIYMCFSKTVFRTLLEGSRGLVL